MKAKAMKSISVPESFSQINSSGEDNVDNPSSHTRLTTCKEVKHVWSKNEDERLKSLVKKGNEWDKIASFFLTKSPLQCYNRWHYVLNPERTIQRPFTKEEDEKIIELVKMHGTKSWHEIAKHLKNRIGIQCKRRWQNYLDPTVKKTAWTKKERKLITSYHSRWGNQWSKIAKKIPGRTDEAIRYYWNCFVIKKLNASHGLKKLKVQKNPRGVVKSTWTKEEDEKLIELMQKDGLKNWTLIAKNFKRQNRMQCRHRWINHLDPSIKKTALTSREKRLIIYYQKLWGNQWSKIATKLPGRTEKIISGYGRYFRKMINAKRNLKKPEKQEAKYNTQSASQHIVVYDEWSKDEDEKLKSLMKTVGRTYWRFVVDHFPHKSADQCFRRVRLFHEGIIRGPFAKIEDEELLELVQKYGPKWSKIAKLMKGRTELQLCQRWDRKYSHKFNTSFSSASKVPKRTTRSTKKSGTSNRDPLCQNVPAIKLQTAPVSSTNVVPYTPVSKKCVSDDTRSHTDISHQYTEVKDTWSKDEDERLKSLVKDLGKPWKKIAAYFPHKTGDQCFKRWHLIHEGAVTGSFTVEEDEKLLQLIKKYGRDWRKIATFLKGRSFAQCRLRWLNCLNPQTKKAFWTEREKKIIVFHRKQLKSKWTDISNKLPGRTAMEIKKFWKTKLKGSHYDVRKIPTDKVPWCLQVLTQPNGTTSSSASKVPGDQSGTSDNKTFLFDLPSPVKGPAEDTMQCHPEESSESIYDFNLYPVKVELVISDEKVQTSPVSNTFPEFPSSSGFQPKIINVSSVIVEEKPQFPVDFPAENMNVSPFSVDANFDVSSMNNSGSYGLHLPQLANGNQMSFTHEEKYVAPQGNKSFIEGTTLQNTKQKLTSDSSDDKTFQFDLLSPQRSVVMAPAEDTEQCRLEECTGSDINTVAFPEFPSSNGLQPKISSVTSVIVEENSQFPVDLPAKNMDVTPFSVDVNLDVSCTNNSFCGLPISRLLNGNQLSFTHEENYAAPQKHKRRLVPRDRTKKKHQMSHNSSAESKSFHEPNAQQRSVKSSCAKTEVSVVSAMRIIYFQAKENLATQKFTALKDLATDLCCSSLAGPSVSSNSVSHDFLADIETALASVIQEEIVKQVNEARWYSIIIDECSDVLVGQSVIIYVRFAHKGKVVTRFLCTTEIEKVSAEQIFVCVAKTFEKLGIDISKCSSLAIDGPSVKRGVRGEVAALFKKHNPHLVSLHCIAHRISLVLSQAVEEFPYLIKYRNILERVHSYFEKSPANTKRLNSMQCDLNLANRKALKLSAIRWLSLGKNVLNDDTSWSVLISVFAVDKCPESQWLLKKMTSYMFLATTAMLNDVLFCVNELRMAFQEKNIDFEFAQSCVNACVENLKSMKNKTGTYFVDFQDKIPKNAGKIFIYEAHVVTDSVEQRKKFEVLMGNFLISIIGHIKDRLGDMDKIEMFGILLPSHLPDSPSELEIYGKEEILKIFQRFSSSVDYDKSELLTEWAFFKLIMLESLKSMTIQEVLEFIFINDMYQKYPLICSIIEYALTIPLYTADCEDGFNTLNLRKTGLKHKINLHHVNNVLMIKTEGPGRQKFDFNRAYEKWVMYEKE